MFPRPDVSQRSRPEVVVTHPRTRVARMLFPEKPMTARESAVWAVHCRLIEDISDHGALPGSYQDWA